MTTTIKSLNKKEKEKVKNFHSKLLTRRYTKEEVEANPKLRFPNNFMATLIESDPLYSAILGAVYFSRGSCSCKELQNYLKFYYSTGINYFKEHKQDISEYERLLEVISNEESYNEVLNELFNLKLISLNKDDTFVMLTPNSKSYFTQAPNNGNYVDFELLKIQKGDFFLRMAQELSISHEAYSLFNRRTRDEQIQAFIKKYYNYFCNVYTFSDKIIKKYGFGEFTAFSGLTDSQKYDILEYELNNILKQSELKNAYVISYKKGILALNCNINKSVTEKSIISSLREAEFIADDEIELGVNKEFSNKFGLNKTSKSKLVIIDKFYKESINSIIEKSNDLREVFEANNISLKFI